MKDYSVEELNALRRVVKNKYLFGRYNLRMDGPRNSRVYFEDQMNKSVEAQVRTHMSAGHTAEDLMKSEETD